MKKNKKTTILSRGAASTDACKFRTRRIPFKERKMIWIHLIKPRKKSKGESELKIFGFSDKYNFGICAFCAV